MHYMNWMGHVALRFCVRVCGCDLLSEWCSSGDDMKKPWMDGCPPRLMSEGVRLVLISEMPFSVRVVQQWR